MKKMDDQKLRALVSGEIKSSIGYIGSQISQVRAESLKAYLGEPYGDEQEGRSKVIMTDAMDTVEWIAPSLMRIFMSSDDAVEFVPTQEEDVPGAKQATEYCNYVFMQDNPGFMNTLTNIKDGLIEKTGVYKVWWDDQDEWERESYRGLTDEAYTYILQSNDVTVLEHTEYRGQAYPGPAGMMTSDVMHDCVLRRKKEAGRVRVEPVPSDEFLISRDGKDIQSARFVGHRQPKTRSELIAMGFKRSVVESLGTDTGTLDTEESIARHSYDQEYGDTNIMNDAMQEVMVIECYIRVDYDGDGIAEMRKVTVAGESYQVLDNEPWDGMRPFAGWSPIPLPHQFYGLSVVDLVKDLQRIRTTVMRQYLDSLYQANSPTYELDTSNLVDQTLQEVTNRTPGSIIRKNNANPALTSAPVNFVGDTAIAGLSVLDQIRENRTGVSQKTMGLAPDSLHDTKGGQDLLFTAAMGRIELIARVYAETCLKDTFKIIFELLNRYQDKPRTIKLRNQWVQMDPRSWKTGMDLTVTVGLGNGNKDQQASQLQNIMGWMAQAIQVQGGTNGPLVKIDNVYNALKKMVEAAGFRDVDSFFTDPANQPQEQQQQKPPSPEEKKAMMDAQIKQAELQQSLQVEMAKIQANSEMERAKMEQNLILKREQMNMEADLKRQQMVLEAELQVRQPNPVQMGGDIG
jgi:hypothetical protein